MARVARNDGVAATFRHMIRSVVLLAALVFTTSAAKAETQDKALTSGLAVGVGAGFESAGLGAHAIYYLQLPNERWRLAAHAGVGFFLRPAASGGVMASFGRRHRLVLDLLVSPCAAISNFGDPEVFYGVGALVGWEWMASYGLGVRTTVGAAYRPELEDEPVNLALNLLSLDYKFW
jgi:hypothetical protein